MPLFSDWGGANAKDVFQLSFGTELTLEDAVKYETGFALVSDNQVLDITTLGDAWLTMRDLQDIQNAYLVKLESSGEGYHVLFHMPNASKIEAGDRYGIWGRGDCMLTAVTFDGGITGSTWVAPNNDSRPDGRDYDYSSQWIFEAQDGGGYTVSFKEGDGRKYLNGGSIGDKCDKIWHLHPLTKTKVAETAFNMTKISFEEALNSTVPVAMVQNDLVLCDIGGAKYSDKKQFDEYAFWVKFEEDDASKGQYFITLNNQDGSHVNNRYLNSSVWSHIWLSGVDKEGTKGEKQDGAVFIVGDLGNNKYSLRTLGAVEGHYNTVNNDNTIKDDYTSKGWVNFCTDGYWKGNATWLNSEPQAWEFYKVTDFKNVYIANGDVPAGYMTQYEERLPLLGTPDGVTITDATYNADGQVMSATFTTSSVAKNIFQYTADTRLTAEMLCNAKSLTIAVSGDIVAADWCFVPGDYPFRVSFVDNKKVYEVTENDRTNGIVDFSIFSTLGTPSTENMSIHVDGITMQNEGRVFYTLNNLEAGAFRTVCLANSAICLNAKCYEVSGKDATNLYLSEVKKLEAGKAYFVEAKEAGAIEFVYLNGTAKATSPTTSNGLVGTFENTTAPRGSYVLSGNKLYFVDSDVAVAANRAYIDMANVRDVTSSEVKGVRLAFDGDMATAINEADGQVLVKAIYSVNGTLQRGMQKGVNIVKMSDGSVKKVMVK